MAEIVVALDQPTGTEALRLAEALPGLGWVKLGSVLFTREGPDLVRAFTARGVRVFLDLKWHDIPNTVAGAVRTARELGVSLATVHGSGGRAMLAAAADATGPPLELAAVSVLTSHDRASYAEALGTESRDLPAEVERIARLARACGLRGVVCSALEAGRVRAVVGPDGWIVVPGIRAPGGDRGDQARVATAGEATAAGATHLVVGRTVTEAPDPVAAYRSLAQEAACAGT